MLLSIGYNAAGAAGVLIELEYSQESLLRHFYGTNLLHALLAFLLFLQ